MSKTTNKFAPEVGDRAVRMAFDHERDQANLPALAEQEPSQQEDCAHSPRPDRGVELAYIHPITIRQGAASSHRACNRRLADRQHSHQVEFQEPFSFPDQRSLLRRSGSPVGSVTAVSMLRATDADNQT
jgi:hypothetical protein